MSLWLTICSIFYTQPVFTNGKVPFRIFFLSWGTPGSGSTPTTTTYRESMGQHQRWCPEFHQICGDVAFTPSMPEANYLQGITWVVSLKTIIWSEWVKEMVTIELKSFPTIVLSSYIYKLWFVNYPCPWLHWRSQAYAYIYIYINEDYPYLVPTKLYIYILHY